MNRHQRARRRALQRAAARRSGGLNGHALLPPPVANPTVPVLLTPKQMAKALQVSPRTVGRLVRAKRIPVIRVGQQTRFEPQRVIDALAKRSPSGD